MIIFKKITARNFLSYGNVPTSVALNEHKNTLIVGENGSGKSVLFSDAICFVLYGKPYRNINKGQLLNSINQKNLEVEIEFSIGSIDYRVRRGIKPGFFEIYKDGVLIDQEAATRDYQGFLEKQIIKINYKTFCQVVILGTASFVPFMQLSSGQRREVIEDVLDISVFSLMNHILKTRISQTREESELVEVRIDSAKKEAVAQQKLIRVIQEARESRVSEEESNIEELVQFRNSLIKQQEAIRASIVEVKKTQPEKVNREELVEFRENVSKLRHMIEGCDSGAKSIQSMTECPTCMQGVGDTHKKKIKKNLSEKKLGFVALLETASGNLERLVAAEKVEEDFRKRIIALTDDLNSVNEKISDYDKSIEKKYALIKSIQSNNSDLAQEQAKLKSISENALKLIERRNQLIEEKNLQDVSLILLKDSGIKAAIIKEYMPIINRLINKYLGMFGFFVNFHLDENFSETIKSRGRDEFSYDSFSEGEKRRIDLAILFAFRQIAEMKNSANCNLLVCDEIGESAFDLVARDAFMEILNSFDGGNNFVISHTAPSHEAYDAVIKVEKKNEFSYFEYLD